MQGLSSPAKRYSGWYTLIICLTFFAYSGFTLHVTARRAIHQRRVNRLDSDAKGRLAESLINAFKLQICRPLNSLGFVYREASAIGSSSIRCATPASVSG